MRCSAAAVFAVLLGGVASAAPCEAPRLRDTAPLSIALARDRIAAEAFTRAAAVCQERGDACDQARLECGGVVSSVISQQLGFDEGAWLRDMLLPYLGQQYPMSRVFGAVAQAADTSCRVELAVLNAAAQRRTAQATRRDLLLKEYTAFGRWAEVQQQKCREKLTAEEQRALAAQAEAERVAAAAAAAQAVKLAGEAARQKVLEDARKAKELNEAAAARAAEELKRREQATTSTLQAQKESEERLRKERLEQEARGTAQRQEAEQKTRSAEEAKQVKERAERTRLAKLQREQLLADAERAYASAVALEREKKQAAVDAVAANPAVSQATVAEAAQATQARVDAERRLAEARVKAERIEVDESHLRSRGHVAALLGGGALAWSNATGTASSSGGALGALVTAHVGFWGDQLTGLAWGLELAIAARFLQPLPFEATPREFDGLASVRYYFGPLGVGAAGEFRLVDPSFGARAFGVGPSLALALVDTPQARVLLSASWLPLGTAVDLARVSGGLELSWQWFTFRLLGSTASRAGLSATLWQATAFAGVRLSW